TNKGLPTPVPAIGRLLALNDSLFASAGSRLFVLPGTSSTWSPADNGLPPNTSFDALTTDRRSVFVGTRDFGIYRLRDADISQDRWFPVNAGIVAAGVAALAVNGNTLVASATAVYPGASDLNALFRSTDQGQTWAPSNITSPSPSVRALSLN